MGSGGWTFHFRCVCVCVVSDVARCPPRHKLIFHWVWCEGEEEMGGFGSAEWIQTKSLVYVLDIVHVCVTVQPLRTHVEPSETLNWISQRSICSTVQSRGDLDCKFCFWADCFLICGLHTWVCNIYHLSYISAFILFLFATFWQISKKPFHKVLLTLKCESLERRQAWRINEDGFQGVFRAMVINLGDSWAIIS